VGAAVYPAIPGLDAYSSRSNRRPSRLAIPPR
jgi:hypothetical protein